MAATIIKDAKVIDKAPNRIIAAIPAKQSAW
jgi:hypothetical protein